MIEFCGIFINHSLNLLRSGNRGFLFPEKAPPARDGREIKNRQARGRWPTRLLSVFAAPAYPTEKPYLFHHQSRLRHKRVTAVPAYPTEQQCLFHHQSRLRRNRVTAIPAYPTEQ
jgi:hypothetical protein